MKVFLIKFLLFFDLINISIRLKVISNKIKFHLFGIIWIILNSFNKVF